MKRKVILDLTVEEINMILLCTAKDKEGIIQELQSYLNVAGPDMAEIIHNTIKKVYDFTDEELKEILDYPVETEN